MSQNDKHAFVFVHGILGFVVLGVPALGLSIRYFRGLPESLKDLPVEVHFPAVPAVGAITARAHALADYIDGLSAPTVHLIGHSMGGLDCRYVAAHLDPARRVRTVTTVATPHHGTPLADWIVSGKGMFPTVAGWLLGAGIEDLTIDACRRFNEAVPDRTDVHYASYAGFRPVDEMPLWYHPWSKMISRLAGDNDSQVPVASARWGEFVKQVRADHLELAGWSLALNKAEIERPFDHIRFYREIIKKIID